MIQDAYLWDEKKQEFKLVRIIDYTPYVKENYFERLRQEKKGWTKKRTMRKIASIPIDVLISMGERGYAILNDDKELNKFLQEHPEFKTCGGKL